MAAPAPKVSVVVPVYNPGGAFDACFGSLLGQSMPARDLELVFVDDGSTDGTGERLDALAAEHAHVRVEHIPNSGWPGRPRNVGLDMARGEYVQFVDNDDRLEREALERMHATAVADRADVVVGKEFGRGRRIPHGIFRRNLHGVRLQGHLELLMMLTPHKLFRRAFLEEHGLRFPEGRRRLEDHPFVLHAYFLSRGISVVADHPCYHWVKGAPGTHASAERYDPDTYFGNVREVLDLVESRTEPGPFRDRLLVHWYRGKMLGRVGGASFVQRDPDYRRGLVEAVRALQRERYPERLDAELPFHLRVRAHLLREGRIEGLEALSAFERQLRARVRLVQATGDGRHLALRVQGRLVGRDEPLVLRRRGERVVWEPPASLRDLLPQEGLDVTDDLEHAGVELYLYRDEDGTEWPLPMRSELRMEPLDGDAVEAVVDARASLSPTIAAAGAPLPAGEWEVRAAVQVAGFSRRRAVKRRGRELVVTSLPPGRIRRGSHAPPAMTRKRRVIRRLPRRLRRALAAAGRAARR